MNKQFFKDAFGWGLMLWIIGYVLGIVLFAVAPPALIGWIIMPAGVIITLLVLWKKIPQRPLKYYLSLAIIWALLAIVLDYFLLVKAFHPADGYYKLDVFIYYALTFLLPIVVGWYKNRQRG